MKYILSLLCALAAIIPLAATAHAATLKDVTFEDDAKKLVVRLQFSEAVNAEEVSHFANNFVALVISGLELTKEQEGKKFTPPGDNAQFLKHVLLQKDEGGAQIRLYLGKLATPADAQVVPLDTQIVVELIKPLWKLGPAAQPAAEEAPAAPVEEAPAEPAAPPVEESTPVEEVLPPADPDAPAEFVPDEAPLPEPANGEAPVEGGTFEIIPDDTTAPAEVLPEEPPAETVPAEMTPPETPPAELIPPAETPPAEAPPVEVTPQVSGQFTPGPDYTQFDLNKVPVNQLDIRGMPFDEALVELVAGTGFNVVVGSGIDEAEVNLSFTQKDISLQSALDLLCFAYDLVYTVQEDAIVFTAKQ